MTHSAFQARHGVNLCPLIYLGIVWSVKSLAKTLKLSDSTNTKKDHTEEIINSLKPTKKAYMQLHITAQNSVAATEIHLKWQTDISSLTEGAHIDWKEDVIHLFWHCERVAITCSCSLESIRNNKTAEHSIKQF